MAMEYKENSGEYRGIARLSIFI